MDVGCLDPHSDDLLAMMLQMDMDKLTESSEPSPPIPTMDYYTTPPTRTLYNASNSPPSLLYLPPSSSSSSSSYSSSSSPETIIPSHRQDSMAAMRDMIFRMAAMQPVQIDAETVKPPPRRRNVRISKDPQSVAARHRRERISEKIRILQQLVPGGTKMDTASMLDEAVHYVKFLKTQLQSLERSAASRGGGFGFSPMAAGMAEFPTGGSGNYSGFRSMYELPEQGFFMNSTQTLI